VLSRLPGGSPERLLRLEVLSVAMSCLFAPLLVQLVVLDRSSVRTGGPFGSWAPVAAIHIAGGLLAIAALSMLRGPQFSLLFVIAALQLALLVAAGLYSSALLIRWPKPEEAPGFRRWNVTVLLLIILTFAPRLAGLVASGHDVAPPVIDLALRCFPLYFLFVGTYYQRRLEFYDVFVKRAGFFVVTSVLLFLCVAVVPPLVAVTAPPVPWIALLAALPSILVAPEIYAAFDRWVNRAWLGRRFATTEAIERFVAGLHGVSSERQLLQRGEELLGETFGTRASIVACDSPSPKGTEPEDGLQAALSSAPDVVGLVRIEARRNGVPYFSEDAMLLASLARVFSSTLGIFRLQERQRAQERTERDLLLQARHAELKALRAQVDPHFLFNSLNTIADLIVTDPSAAEETVEHLSEMFRRTLGRSESEWARLGDEVEFARCYLAIQKARFRDRLRLKIDVDQDANSVVVPAMIIQTLVENAIRHGIAARSEGGTLELRARRLEDQVRIDVIDDGPGFAAASAAQSASETNGFGLRNVRERLAGYFGERAALTIRREASSRTVVSLAVPFAAMQGHEPGNQ
jgi:two-component sensor histidine kinase